MKNASLMGAAAALSLASTMPASAGVNVILVSSTALAQGSGLDAGAVAKGAGLYGSRSYEGYVGYYNGQLYYYDRTRNYYFYNASGGQRCRIDGETAEIIARAMIGASAGAAVGNATLDNNGGAKRVAAAAVGGEAGAGLAASSYRDDCQVR